MKEGGADNPWKRFSSGCSSLILYDPFHYLQNTLLKVRALDKVYKLNFSKTREKILIKIHWHSGSIKLGVTLKNTVKFLPEIILTEERSLKRLWEEQTYFTAINQTLQRRAIKTAASSELNKQQWVFSFWPFCVQCSYGLCTEWWGEENNKFAVRSQQLPTPRCQ